MKLLKRALMISLIIISGIMPLVASSKEFGGDSLGAFVDGYTNQTMLNEQSFAGTIAIVHNGELIFSKGYGYQSLEPRIPVEADKTIFRLASVSKLFTWVAIMQQVEQGKLDLDEDINKYLKTFQIEDTWPGQPVTLRHIMTHTAGFEASSMWHLVASGPDKLMPLAAFMKKLQPFRVNPPGVQVAYSNYATSLAGLIVSNVSGLAFEDYVQQNIFDVLGMKNSSFYKELPKELSANVVDTYKIRGADIVAASPDDVSNMAPAAALVGTSTDMVIFAQAMLNGGAYKGSRILNPNSVYQMLSTQYRQDSKITGSGLGFLETQANGSLLYGHGGDMPSFHSELVIDKKNNLAYFVSFAGNGGALLRSNFKPALYNKYFPNTEDHLVAHEGFAERGSKYVGTYKSWRSNFTTLQKFLLLMKGNKVILSPDNTLVIGGRKYVEIGKNLFQVLEPLKTGGFPRLIAFQENEAGEVTGFAAEDMSYMTTYKADWYENIAFNGLMLASSLIVFVGVFLRNCYQRKAYKMLSPQNKSVRRSSLIVANVNLVSIVSLILVVFMAGDITMQLPATFKIWLVFPMIVLMVFIYQIIKTVQVWNQGLLGGVGERIQFSFVTIAAGFMCWFYWFWNFLGYNYIS